MSLLAASACSVDVVGQRFEHAGPPVPRASAVAESAEDEADAGHSDGAGAADAGNAQARAAVGGTEPEPDAQGETSNALGTALAPAPIGFEGLEQSAGRSRPVPVALTIESIEITQALVIPVGINSVDASMEVPPADEVGWYRFGPNPGEDGSAVLAAHIAYDGRHGVFLRLSELPEGSVVVIDFDDGSRQRWLIERVTNYVKTELPTELFATNGAPRLALITCGGSFNPSLRSYDSNTVAIARLL